jgi:hypothetical protein
MKPSKVTYSKTFPIGMIWEKIGIEIDLFDGDDPRKALYEAKKTVESFHFESNRAADKQKDEIDVPKNAEERKKVILDGIASSKDVTVLETYKIMIKGHEDLQLAYRKKLIELQNI